MTPLPSPYIGRSYLLLKLNSAKIQQPHQPGKETDTIPSPKGEGIVTTPVNWPNQGEVPLRFLMKRFTISYTLAFR